MMSNPHGSYLQERHRQHRRQISTPTALEAAKAPTLPGPALQRIHAHRRGQSLDQRAFQMQDGKLPVTNQAAVQQQPQSVLRELQQQRLARQGHQVFPLQHSASMPFVPECQTLSQEDLQMLASQGGNENQQNMAYMNPNFTKLPNHPMGAQPTINANFNLMQQQQQLLRSQSFPNNNAQMVNDGAWDVYHQDNMSAFPPQTNMIPADMRRLSVQSDAAPNTQRPETPTHSNTRKRH